MADFVHTLVVFNQPKVRAKPNKISVIINLRFGAKNARYTGRREIMKTKFLVGMLLAASSLLAAPRVSIGIGIGHPYVVAPPPVVVYEPAYPVYEPAYPVYAPTYRYGYTWVDGYSYYVGPRRYWHSGYWAPPVYGPYYGRGYRIVPRHHSYRYSYYGRYR